MTETECVRELREENAQLRRESERRRKDILRWFHRCQKFQTRGELLEQAVRVARTTQENCSCCKGKGSYAPDFEKPNLFFKCPYCFPLWEALNALDAAEVSKKCEELRALPD